MMEATDLKKNLVSAIKSVVSPAYLADETVATAGKRYRAMWSGEISKNARRPAGVKASVTFWIDKQKAHGPQTGFAPGRPAYSEFLTEPGG